MKPVALRLLHELYFVGATAATSQQGTKLWLRRQHPRLGLVLLHRPQLQGDPGPGLAAKRLGDKEATSSGCTGITGELLKNVIVSCREPSRDSDFTGHEGRLGIRIKKKKISPDGSHVHARLRTPRRWVQSSSKLPGAEGCLLAPPALSASGIYLKEAY